MKKAGLLVLIVLFLSLIVAAAEILKIEVSKPVLIKEASQGQSAYFEFAIKNRQAVSDTFIVKPDELSVAPLSKIFQHITLTPEQIKIGAFDEKTIKAEIKLFDDVEPNNNYVTQIFVISVRDPSLIEKIRFTVNLFSADDVFDIKPNLQSEGIIPGVGVPIPIVIKNKLNANFKDVEINAELSNENFKDVAILTTNFDKGETKTKDFLFNLGSSASPGTYNLKIRAFDDSRVTGSYDGAIEVLPNYNIEGKVEKESRFLKGKVIVKKKNHGNLPVEESFQTDKKIFRDLFMKSNVDSKIINNKNTWVFLIMPNDESVLVIEYNYRAFFLVLLIAIIVILTLYFSFRKEITIRKSLIKIREYQNTVEIKVLIHVKNKLGKDIEDLKIVDIVPHIVKPTGDFSTLKPNKIVKGETGIKLIWEVPVLTGKEERILGYKATTRLNIVGKLELPPAAIIYEHKNKTIKIKSNSLILKI